MDFASYVTGLVREQLRRMPTFAGVTRDDFDNSILADLERDIRRELQGWEDGTARLAYMDAREDIETKAMLEAAATKKARKKRSTA